MILDESVVVEFNFNVNKKIKFSAMIEQLQQILPYWESSDSQVEKCQPIPIELFKEGTFSYRILDSSYQNESLHLIAQSFIECGLTKCLGVKNPSLECKYEDWKVFWSFWIKICCNNSLSIVAIDTTTSQNKLAGVLCVRDIGQDIPGFFQLYQDSSLPLSKLIKILYRVDGEAQKIYPHYFNKGVSVDMACLAVHPDYMGKKLSSHLIKASEMVSKTAGFQFATMEALNGITSILAQKNNYSPCSKVDAKIFQIQGQFPFSEIEEFHRYQIFWAKNLTFD